MLASVAQLQQPLGNTGLWDPACAGTIPAENLARAYGTYATHRDRVQPDWSGNWNQRYGGSLAASVNRAQPDTVDLASPGGARDNRSVLQRLFHLIDDLSGARMCNKPAAAVRVRFNVPVLGERSLTVPGAGNIDQCRLVEVPDAASFYARSIVGDGRAMLPMELPGIAGSLADVARTLGLPVDTTLDRLVESQSGITGFNSQPSPFAIARLVFNPRPNAFLGDLMDPPSVRNVLPTPSALPPSPTPAGRAVRDVHPGTIFVWESYCFYDSMRPLLAAFARHDRHTDGTLDPRWTPGRPIAYMHPRNIDMSRGTQLFGALISAFHRNWATRAATDYQSRESCATCPEGMAFSRQSGASRYEPIFAEALDAGLLQTLGAVTADLRAIDVGGGRNGVDAARLLRARARRPAGKDRWTAPRPSRSPSRTATGAAARAGATGPPRSRRRRSTTSSPTPSTRWTRSTPRTRPRTTTGSRRAPRWSTSSSPSTARSRRRASTATLAPIARALVSWLRDRVAAPRGEASTRGPRPRRASRDDKVGAPFAAGTGLPPRPRRRRRRAPAATLSCSRA
ncbi:MAG: hypothetical protein U0325_27505 [Polyangiales bacterium]